MLQVILPLFFCLVLLASLAILSQILLVLVELVQGVLQR